MEEARKSDIISFFYVAFSEASSYIRYFAKRKSQVQYDYSINTIKYYKNYCCYFFACETKKDFIINEILMVKKFIASDVRKVDKKITNCDHRESCKKQL